jgi:hypothetical protein
MVVVFNKTALAVAKDHKGVSAIPQDASIPTSLAEDIPTRLNATPAKRA